MTEKIVKVVLFGIFKLFPLKTSQFHEMVSVPQEPRNFRMSTDSIDFQNVSFYQFSLINLIKSKHFI